MFSQRTLRALREAKDGRKTDMTNIQAVTILTYHSLDDSGSVLSTPPRVFAEQMQILSQQGVKVVPLDMLGPMLGSTFPSKPLVAITFDDGFRNVYEHGFPVLQRFGFAGTVFLVTDYCGKTNDWPCQPHWVERRPILGWTEVREMSMNGIAFGSHTRTHPDLRELPPRQIEEELVVSKGTIEDALGRPVDMFAYPYGTYNETVKHLVQSHFSLSCTTTLGFVKPGSDPLALERVDMYYLRHPMLFKHLFSREMGAYIHLRSCLRSLRVFA
jgi:peptidoglycan/xylan/chitin deacetylase (PgdA/CDA1 family)